MDRVIDKMNFNYYNRESSDLAIILLGIEKVSLNNGTYNKMRELFDREILSSKCFSDGKHDDMDNLITFNTNLKNAMYMQPEEPTKEAEHHKSR